jgi:hypothetical protein
MQGDVSISGNKVLSSSNARGGGVFINNQTTLTKTGGIIYGFNETGEESDGNNLKNTAQTLGDAVYYDASATKYRNTTVGQGQDLSTGSNANWSD